MANKKAGYDLYYGSLKIPKNEFIFGLTTLASKKARWVKRRKKKHKLRNPKTVRKTAHRKAKAYFKKHPEAHKTISGLFSNIRF